MVARFTTIGHSSRNLDEFLDMLREAQVKLLVDVRSFPRSRTNPVFNIDSLPNDLADAQIGYRHSPALGGRRSKQSGIEETTNAMWRVRSFHNYADHALGDEFSEVFDGLLRLGRHQRVALMCSEAVWWRCHRRIIIDYLLLEWSRRRSSDGARSYRPSYTNARSAENSAGKGRLSRSPRVIVARLNKENSVRRTLFERTKTTDRARVSG